MGPFEKLQRGVGENAEYQERLGTAADDESLIATASAIADELGVESCAAHSRPPTPARRLSAA